MLSGVAKVATRLKFISASAGIAAIKAKAEVTPKSRADMIEPSSLHGFELTSC
jgi:hypothetical protein